MTARFFISACDDGDSLNGRNPRQRTWDIIDRSRGPDCSVGNYTSRELARKAAKALNEGDRT